VSIKSNATDRVNFFSFFLLQVFEFSIFFISFATHFWSCTQ
jgi:hypothetical protein